ncbi:hypothetical protein K438DRAFT_1798028 [Mycena galopus ATCC 62051]|nr:hypothetical protein K438DRAFT_1798028 [Mycena galopus ATCC 62051]
MTTISLGFSFPPELEREIFETTAACFPGFIPTLLRVCRRSQIWIEPLLYRVVIISSTRSNSPLLLSALASKTPTFLQTAVRHILIHDYDDSDTPDSLLAKCSGIVSLSTDGKLDPERMKMRLQKLALTVPSEKSTWNLAGFTHPLLVSITHLDLYQGDTWGPGTWRDWSGLASLPVLTHLALSESIATHIISQVVVECPRLVVIAIVTYPWERDSARSLTENLTFIDLRVVVLSMSIGYAADWEMGARGGNDFWARAEAFLQRKRAGEIEATCYFLDESTTINSS